MNEGNIVEEHDPNDWAAEDKAGVDLPFPLPMRKASSYPGHHEKSDGAPETEDWKDEHVL